MRVLAKGHLSLLAVAQIVAIEAELRRYSIQYGTKWEKTT